MQEFNNYFWYFCLLPQAEITSFGCEVRCPAGHVKFTFKSAVGRGTKNAARRISAGGVYLCLFTKKMFSARFLLPFSWSASDVFLYNKKTIARIAAGYNYPMVCGLA